MSERDAKDGRGLTRRQALGGATLALTVLGSGRLDPSLAAPLHRQIQARGGPGDRYQPLHFRRAELATLRRLCELILPADERSGSAVDAGAPEFIDLLSARSRELGRIFTSGLLWLDHEMKRRAGASFADAGEEAQREMLDELAAGTVEPEPGYQSYDTSPEYASFQDYRTDPASGLGPGIRFFGWLRRLTVDAFYTSRIGIEDVGYPGNGSSTEYTVPEEAIRYAFARSPFRDR